jgi:DNA-binding transcriptional LysR family regulator
MDRLQTMSTFVRVVAEGGFAAAARILGVDQALVTRQVADLERHLGVKLLERTTRSMRLTSAGETYLARCRAILSDVTETEAMISRSFQDMAGRVRLAVPTVFANELPHRLADLQEQLPEVVMEIAVMDRPVDLIAEGFDVVVSNAAFGTSAAVATEPLLRLPLVLCASPRYLQRHATPCVPRALESHRCVAQWVSGEEGHAVERWTLEHADAASECVDVRVAMRTDSYALSLDAVRHGAGIGRFTPQLIAADLANGQLVTLLPHWYAGQLSFNLVYPGHRLLPRRVRHLIDTMLALRDGAELAAGV